MPEFAGRSTPEELSHEHRGAHEHRAPHAADAHSMSALEARLADRDRRLQGVREQLTHELKNRIGAVIGAGQLLQEEWIEAAERVRFAGMVVENAEWVRQVIVELSALVRLDGDEGQEPAPPIDATPPGT